MHGLEVFDENGKKVFGSEESLTRFLLSFTIGRSAGSRSVPGLSTGTPDAIVLPLLAANTSFLGVPSPPISFNTATEVISWGASSDNRVSGYTLEVFVY